MRTGTSHLKSIMSQQSKTKTGHSKALRTSARPLGSFLPRITKKAFAKFGFSTTTLLTDWAGIVGSDFAKFTRPERLRWPRRQESGDENRKHNRENTGATLTLRVDPARALEAQYGVYQIRERINGFFGYNAIAQIRIIQAPVTPADNKVRLTPTPHRQPKPQKKPASPTLRAIRDDGLRRALTTLEASLDENPDKSL